MKNNENDTNVSGVNPDLARTMQERSMALKENYEISLHRKIIIIVMLCIAVFALFLLGISIGGATFSIRESWGALLSGIFSNKEELDVAGQIMWKLRLPRVLMAIVSGAGLAAAGLVMQTILKNPLAAPYTLGISSAASFGAAISIVSGIGLNTLLPSVKLPEGYNVILNAFICAFICTFAIYALSRTQRVTAETIVLFGVAMNFLFSAGTSFMQYLGTQEELAELVYWMFGSLSKTTWNKFWLVLVCTIVSVLLIYRKSWDFNALLLGDETAGSLGLNVERLRIFGLIISSFATAIIVSLLGPIGFIGLVAPHLGRMMVGTDHRFLIPVSCLLGSCLLLAADILANVILSPRVIPVGIVTSFVGVPLLVYLITRRKAEYW